MYFLDRKCREKEFEIEWPGFWELVVMKTGIEHHFSSSISCVDKKKNPISCVDKIPPYAKDYKKEYFFIKGLNKEFEYFINKLDKLNDGLFESNIADRIKYIMKRFFKAQEKGKIKDISKLKLESNVISNLIFINEQFELYKIRWDFFNDSDDTDDSDSDDDRVSEYLVDGKPYPGFKEFYDIFKKIFNQIKNEDSDSDSDSEFENYNIILPDSDDDDF